MSITTESRPPELEVEYAEGARPWFWDRVHKYPDDEGGCWEWEGALSSFGYGRVTIKGLGFQAHRIAWILTHGPIGGGLVIDHCCENHACVRPLTGKHCEPVTQSENVRRSFARNPRTDTRSRPKRDLVTTSLALPRTLNTEFRAHAKHFGIGASKLAEIIIFDYLSMRVPEWTARCSDVENPPEPWDFYAPIPPTTPRPRAVRDLAGGTP